MLCLHIMQSIITAHQSICTAFKILSKQLTPQNAYRFIIMNILMCTILYTPHITFCHKR